MIDTCLSGTDCAAPAPTGAPLWERSIASGPARAVPVLLGFAVVGEDEDGAAPPLPALTDPFDCSLGPAPAAPTDGPGAFPYCVWCDDCAGAVGVRPVADPRSVAAQRPAAIAASAAAMGIHSPNRNCQQPDEEGGEDWVSVAPWVSVLPRRNCDGTGSSASPISPPVDWNPCSRCPLSSPPSSSSASIDA